jgi:hypothetical protein
MKKLQTTLIMTLLVTFFASTVPTKAYSSEALGIMTEAVFFGAFTAGAGAALPEMTGFVASLAATGYTQGVFNDQKNKLAKEAIVREVAAYQTSGEVSLLLEFAINTLKSENPNLSDSEAIDILTEAVQ